MDFLAHFALQFSDRVDCMCPTDCLHSRFRKAEVFDLAFLKEFFHRSRHVLYWHIRVYTVLVEKIDGIHHFEKLGAGVSAQLARMLTPAQDMTHEGYASPMLNC